MFCSLVLFFCLVVIVDVVAGSTRVLRSFNFIFRKFAFLLIVLLIFPVFVELTVSSKAPIFFSVSLFYRLLQFPGSLSE